VTSWITPQPAQRHTQPSGWRNATICYCKKIAIFCSIYLARSANLPTGLYILPSVVSFFFKCRQIITGSTGLIFTTFAPNDRYLFEYDRFGPLFSRDVAMATNFMAISGYMHSLSRAAFENGLRYRNSDSKIFNGKSLATFCAKIMKIGPVTLEITMVINAPFWMRRQKSAYLTEYFTNCWSSVVFELNRGRECCDSAEISRFSFIWHNGVLKRIGISQFRF